MLHLAWQTLALIVLVSVILGAFGALSVAVAAIGAMLKRALG